MRDVLESLVQDTLRGPSPPSRWISGSQGGGRKSGETWVSGPGAPGASEKEEAWYGLCRVSGRVPSARDSAPFRAIYPPGIVWSYVVTVVANSAGSYRLSLEPHLPGPKQEQGRNEYIRASTISKELGASLLVNYPRTY